MKRWMPTIVEAKPAANGLIPVSRARGEVAILAIGAYRKVVLAVAAKAVRRHGTFFSSSA